MTASLYPFEIPEAQLRRGGNDNPIWPHRDHKPRKWGQFRLSYPLEFADWTTVFAGDERLTAALLDRLTHRCHVLEFRGSSYRFRESLAAREGRLDEAPVTSNPD